MRLERNFSFITNEYSFGTCHQTRQADNVFKLNVSRLQIQHEWVRLRIPVRHIKCAANICLCAFLCIAESRRRFRTLAVSRRQKMHWILTLRAMRNVEKPWAQSLPPQSMNVSNKWKFGWFCNSIQHVLSSYFQSITWLNYAYIEQV